MRCHQVEEFLEQLLDQNLDLKQRSVVENHLLSCPSCSGKLADISMTREIMRDLEEAELPPGLHERIMASVYETLERQQSGVAAIPTAKRGLSASERALLYEAGRVSPKRGTPVWMRGAALVAVAAVLIITGKQWVDQGKSGIAVQGEDITGSTPYAVYSSAVTGGMAYDPSANIGSSSGYRSLLNEASSIAYGVSTASSEEDAAPPEDAEIQEQEVLPAIEVGDRSVPADEPDAAQVAHEEANTADGALPSGAMPQALDVPFSMFSYIGETADDAMSEASLIDEAVLVTAGGTENSGAMKKIEGQEAEERGTEGFGAFEGAGESSEVGKKEAVDMTEAETINEMRSEVSREPESDQARRSLSLQEGVTRVRVDINAAMPETRPISEIVLDPDATTESSEYAVNSHESLPRMFAADQANPPSVSASAQPGQWVLYLSREILDAGRVEAVAHRRNCLNWVGSTNDEELILYGSMRNLQQLLQDLNLSEPKWSLETEQRDWKRILTQEVDRWFFLSLFPEPQ